MIKSLFLAPGRLVAKFFAKEKKRQFRSIRQKSTDSGSTVILSLVIWLVVIAGVIIGADKVGLLNKALDVGVEVANSDDNQNEPPASEPGGFMADGGRAVVDPNLPNGTTAPPPATAEQPPTVPDVSASIQKAEMWLVILHTIPKASRAEAERLQTQYRNRGLTVEIMDTDNFPLLKTGFWIIAQGPFDDQASAQAAGNIAKSFNSKLMVRQGL